MKLLSGSDLASFIKQRQQSEVHRVTQQLGRSPKLAILVANDDPVIDTYVRLKKNYGEEIGVEVTEHRVEQSESKSLISQLNSDSTIDGVIVQLPLADSSQTDEIVNLINAAKDVDGLGKNAKFDPATPTAILWLLAGYNIDLRDKRVLLIGQGRLVGLPLSNMLNKSSISHEVIDETVEDLAGKTRDADVIITATGHPGLLRPKMIKQNAVVIDAGTTSEDGQIKGDLSPEVYDRDDLTLTPVRGGVGPLTICALFENVLKAARTS